MTNITLKNTRLAFCDSLFEAKKYEAESKYAKYGAVFLLNPEDSKCAESIEKIMKEAAILIKDKYTKKPHKMKYGYGEGNDRVNKNGEIYGGHEGMFYVSASNRYQPITLARNKAKLTAEQGVLYAGCYVDALVSLWISDNKKNDPWVNVNLLGVRFLKDGESFGGGSGASEDDFDDLDDEDDDDNIM